MPLKLLKIWHVQLGCFSSSVGRISAWYGMVCRMLRVQVLSEAAHFLKKELSSGVVALRCLVSMTFTYTPAAS